MATTHHSLALLVILATCIALPGFAQDAVPDISRGASLYAANCGRCHNPRSPAEFSDYSWPLIITHMRVVAGLPGDQARSIEAFLIASNNPSARRTNTARKSHTARRAHTAVPLEVSSGAELINQYGCRGCHRIGTQGGTIGPSLNDVVKRRSRLWLKRQIKTPREHNPQSVMPDFGLNDEQVRAIVRALQRAE